MKYKIIYTVISFVTLVGLLSSCSKVTEPYYTTIKKIYDVNYGDKLQEVNQTLGVKPYDFYFDVKKGSFVYVYKYMHEYHTLHSPARSKEALTYGTSRFKEPSNVYMEFNQDSKELLGFYTDNGKEKTIDILKQENTLREVQKDYTNYEKLNINGTRQVTNTRTSSPQNSNLKNSLTKKESKKLIKNSISRNEVYFNSLKRSDKNLQKMIYASGDSRHVWDLQDIDYVDANSYKALKGLTSGELRYYKYNVLRKVIKASGKKASDINRYLSSYTAVRTIGNILMVIGYPVPFVLLVRAGSHSSAKKNVSKYRR